MSFCTSDFINAYIILFRLPLKFELVVVVTDPNEISVMKWARDGLLNIMCRDKGAQ